MGKHEFKTAIKAMIKLNFDDRYKLDDKGSVYVSKTKGDQHTQGKYERILERNKNHSPSAKRLND